MSTSAFGATPVPGLVAAYSFNEGSGTTVADASGNNNTGTISGATWNGNGKYGKALFFDGVNDRVVINASPSLNLFAAMTLEAWVITGTSQSDWRSVIQREPSAYALHASSNFGPLRPAGGGMFNGAATYIGAPTSIPLSTWTHLALTYDGAMLRLYVNGIQVASTPRTGPIQPSSNPISIGGNAFYGLYFKGRIDEVRIYNRALAAAEIQLDKTIPVPSSSPTIGLGPTSLTFTGVQGGANPANQTLSITNTGGGTLSWSVSDNATWLTVSPASGSTAPGTVTASVNLAGLAAGTYNATITATATGATNTPQTAPVTLTVTAVAPTSPTISLSPTSLTFSATQGGTNPAAKTVSITNTGGGTLSWTVSDNAAWLSLSPASGTAPGSATASVILTGLAAGTYNATITVTATGATNTPRTVPVTLTITAASPTIGLSPTSLSFTGVQGGANPTNQTLSITNTGGGTMSWSVSDTATWLTLSPTSGTAPGSATMSVNLTGLAAGTYNATISVTATGATNSPRSVPVTLTVTAASPTIGLSPTSLTFSGTQGGTNPAAKTVSITNTGGGTLSWTVSDNAAWLSLSPASGTAPGSATASVNLTGLAAGTYNATITVTATGATNTPRTVPVMLTVTAPVSQSAIVTSMVPDASGATVTIQGPGQVLEFIYNAQSTYTGIPSFTAGTANFRHTFSWPQGTTFACYRTRGTDNLYTDQACASVTSGPPPTSGTVTLTWNVSTSPDVADYKVYMGTASGVYGPATSVGNVTTYQVPNLTTGQTYYFSVTAVDTSANESSHSNEVSKSVY